MEKMNNKEKGDVFKQKVAEYFKDQGVQLSYEYRVDVGLSSKYKKQHAFDPGNSELLIECKYYDWTESNNNPGAKISTLNKAILYLYTAPTHFKKKMFVKETSQKGKRQSVTLIEYYVRLYKYFEKKGRR